MQLLSPTQCGKPAIFIGSSTDMKTQYQTIFHLSSGDPGIHKTLIRQIYNLLDALPEVSVEIVTHGEGIGLLLADSPNTDMLCDLHDRGIRLLVCQNTLKQKNIPEELLPEYTETVPAAVAHLVVRQHEGWSYIKAGF